MNKRDKAPIEANNVRFVHKVTGAIYAAISPDIADRFERQTKYRGRWVTPFDALRKVLATPEWSGGELRVVNRCLYYYKNTASIQIKKDLWEDVLELSIPWTDGQDARDLLCYPWGYK